MNILYQNRPMGMWLGGDAIQLKKTMGAMQKLGFETAFNDEPLIRPALALRLYDVVHTFNFSMQWTKYQIWAAKNAGRKVVCSMIYHEMDDFVSYEDQQVMLDSLDAAIFLTEGEVDRVRRHLRLDDSKIHIVPNGIDKMWFSKKPETGSFLLTVGRLERAKGQLAVAKAAKQLGLNYVCIGTTDEPAYRQLLEQEGATVLNAMEPDQLREYYRKCSAYVLASRAEVMPLTVMEAGAQAKNIVLTDHCEWKVPNAEYVEFDNIESITGGISRALAKSPNLQLQNVLSDMTWESVAQQLIRIYQSL